MVLVLLLLMQDIPSTFEQLKSLVILNIDRNQLTALPPEVSAKCLILLLIIIIIIIILYWIFTTSGT